ncbi:MAG: hypothetical protein LBL91_06425 [Lachnospiraceae bacterium]|jgi:hypothetical protein|nr:hypothetical protein [Lachnospiraceae bacterium]
MSFIGILTNKKSEPEFESLITCKPKNNIIMINHSNIENVRNIKFDTVLLDKKVSRDKGLTKKIVENAKKLVINADISIDEDIITNIKAPIITYGFNQKSTITASSIENNDALICVQRNIKDVNNNVVEPQEIKISKLDKSKNAYVLMGAETINIIYGNNK